MFKNFRVLPECTPTEDEHLVTKGLLNMSARTLQELVAAAASLHADRLAVTHSVSGKPSASLTYRDLVQLADEFSRALQNNCSPRSGVIGLYCRDDLFVPVWILGWVQTLEIDLCNLFMGDISDQNQGDGNWGNKKKKNPTKRKVVIPSYDNLYQNIYSEFLFMWQVQCMLIKESTQKIQGCSTVEFAGDKIR